MIWTVVWISLFASTYVLWKRYRLNRSAATAHVEAREPDPVPEEPLDVRLHEFGQILSEPANATSDPREMIHLPGFQPAVDALSDDLVPIETLRHYASGE